MAGESPPEILVCDTSFVSRLPALRVDSDRFAHWDDEVVARIDRAILAISVVTLAEIRFGYKKACWGQARIDESEHRLASFLHIPLDEPDLDEWASLRDYSRRKGCQAGDNDLWIASTANTRNFPLVTCDKDHDRLDDHMRVPVIYLPPHP